MKNAYNYLAFVVGVTASTHLLAEEDKNTGAPVRCIPIHQIRSTEIIDDQTVRFRLHNGREYLNHLPQRCNSLSFYKAFTYATSQSELCNVDIIAAVDSSTGEMRREVSCGLGMFTPVAKEKAKKD